VTTRGSRGVQRELFRPNPTHSRLDWWLAAAVVIVGAALRVRQYAAGSALWLDELALARTIVARSLLPLLTGTLAYDQIAPRGFLLVEKLVVLGLGPGEWQLRLASVPSNLAALACGATNSRPTWAPSGATRASSVWWRGSGPLDRPRLRYGDRP